MQIRCFVLGSRLFGDGEVDVILGVLSDKYCRKILYAIIEKPKSAFEISLESNILLSTVYRKLVVLKDYKFVQTRCEIRSDGKKRFLYQSKIGSISAFLDKDLVDVKITPNSVIFN